jgi:sugar phosphate isomerase/epimerase
MHAVKTELIGTPMLAISTSFLSQTVADGGRLLQAVADYGLQWIELDCRINRTQLQQIKSGLGSSRMRVASLHNYCPFPALKPNVPPGGDYFDLASPDRSERDLAVEWTIRTIEHAHDLEAGRVVLHCGAVEMTPNQQRIYAWYQAEPGENDRVEELLSRELERRRRCRQPHLDAIRFSLDRLLNVAQRYDVRLGLENRYHYFEIPDRDEFNMLFDEFEGAPVGYWHDTGHAHAQELLGIVTQADLLESQGDRLVGIHLHDAVGLKDHLAPGTGEIDFKLLDPHLGADAALVIELAPGTGKEDVGQAVAFAKAMKNGDFLLDLE